MKRSIAAIILGGWLDWYGPAAAQSIEDVDRLWQQTMDALRGGQQALAHELWSRARGETCARPTGTSSPGSTGSGADGPCAGRVSAGDSAPAAD